MNSGSVLAGTVADVTDYGALANTTADSSGAFNAAIAAVSNAGGGVVYIPDGEYVLASNLVITASNVLVRGQSRDGTKLYFAASISGSDAAGLTFTGGSENTSGDVLLAADGVERSHTVAVADASEFSVGDDVELGFVITQDFINGLGMHGLWDSTDNSALNLRKVFFRREITAIDTTSTPNIITFDVPLRYPMLMRDAAAIHHDTRALSECGVEHLSVNNAIDVSVAANNPRAHAIAFNHVKDCYLNDVSTYLSANAPDSTDSLQSGGVYVLTSKRVTIANSTLENSQNHGDNGAGYAFEASMCNDVLFHDDHTSNVRHGFIQNWDFGSNGLVFQRCDAQGDTANNSGVIIPGTSEFHHRLAMACLYDDTHDSSGFNAYNRGTESSNSGVSSTEDVFWNISGDGSSTIMRSYQAGMGYVIGTYNVTATVSPGLIDTALGYAANTGPTDFLEGDGMGKTLEPQSLFDDQLAKRLATLQPN